MTDRPPPHSGLRHIALFVQEFERCEHFYCTLLGMQVEWRPDADNLYLCSGNDNLALHRATSAPGERTAGAAGLDHIGFILNHIDDVDAWHDYLRAAGVTIAQPPKTHRDGARSFYCRDPADTLVQLIYHPPLVESKS